MSMLRRSLVELRVKRGEWDSSDRAVLEQLACDSMACVLGADADARSPTRGQQPPRGAPEGDPRSARR